MENWSILTDLDLQRFERFSYLFKKTERSGSDVVHRKLLKFVLGVSRTCHSLAIYGETAEVPLSLKGYRLMLNYWVRLRSLPATSLAKKALIENANIRSNWIRTIEKLVTCMRLVEVPAKKFKETTKDVIQSFYETNWKNTLLNEDISRMRTYKYIKDEFVPSKHLGLPYDLRRVISRLRCSNHSLVVEKGRQKNPKTPREERLCLLCDAGGR